MTMTRSLILCSLACATAAAYCAEPFAVKLDGEKIPSAQLNGETQFEATGKLPLSLYEIPASLAFTKMYQPPSPLPEGAKITLECCEGPCDFVIALYRCKGCAASDDDGGLAGALLRVDWTIGAGACAPYFSNPAVNEDQHPMVVFHKRFEAGAVINFQELQKDASAIVIFATSGYTGVFCPEIVNPHHQGPNELHTCTRSCYVPPSEYQP